VGTRSFRVPTSAPEHSQGSRGVKRRHRAGFPGLAVEGGGGYNHLISFKKLAPKSLSWPLPRVTCRACRRSSASRGRRLRQLPGRGGEHPHPTAPRGLAPWQRHPTAPHGGRPLMRGGSASTKASRPPRATRCSVTVPSTIAIAPNITQYFQEVISDAMRVRRMEATDAASTYLVSLLCSFTHPDEEAASSFNRPLTFLLH